MMMLDDPSIADTHSKRLIPTTNYTVVPQQSTVGVI